MIRSIRYRCDCGGLTEPIPSLVEVEQAEASTPIIETTEPLDPEADLRCEECKEKSNGSNLPRKL